ncbi:LysR family transcriptional regulator [Arthrobacter sp. TmT3-37]
MFTLIQLQSFVAVAEELHFGAAAERLNMTQPPLSRQIQILEREVGSQLFDRSSRRVELTAAGTVLLPSARQILDLAAKTELDVRRVANGSAGSVTISYTAIAGQTALPQLLRRTAEEQAGVSLVLRELVSTDQMDGLVNGSVDIGLLRPIVVRPGVLTRPIMQDRLVIATPADSDIAVDGDSLPLSALRDSPLMMYSTAEARYFHDLVLRLFSSADVHPRITQYASQVPALLAFVQAGLGVSLVPASARSFAPADVRFYEIEDSRTVRKLNRVELDVAWNENTTNPAVLKLLDLLP